MTSKERVHRALERQSTDRVPIFMWYHPQTTRRLGRLLEIPGKYIPLAMGDDIRQAWVSNNYPMEGIVHEHDGESHVDDWAIEWTRIDGFNQISKYPLGDADGRQLLQYKFPFDRIEPLIDLMKPVMQLKNDYFVGCDVSPCVFEMYWRLRGMEKTLLEMALDPDLTREMHTWRRMVKPFLKQNAEVGKKHGLYVAFHSCGAIRPIIGDLIEIGVDVLNPIQCNCPGMNPMELKKQFGKDLAFMGGVDTQGVLPGGTEHQVRKATAELLEAMTADGGGYIFAASHTVPPETPDDNIFAMYDEAGISRQEIFDRAADIRKSVKSI